MQRIAPRHHQDPRAHAYLTIAGAALLLGLTACGGEGGGDGDAAVRAAEAQVAEKQEALADAKSDLAESSEEFCGAAEDYILAIDRYGDVITQTAATVGDVTVAGADLERPRDDALAGAEEAVEAQQGVTQAKQELAEAEAALEAATSRASGSPSTPAASSSPKEPKPLAPADTVSRVEQAEAEYAAAQEGVTDQTPLTQASQQFNAAAVALEMSWLQLLADAGCLTDEQQVQAEAAVSAYTTSLQQSLSDAGYYDGAIDGIYGPQTVQAVEALQTAHGLPVTGTLDKASAAALDADLAALGGAIARDAVTSTAALQQTLKLAGFWDGPIDGTWTPELSEALKDFQTDLGVKPSGSVDAATIAAVEKAIAEGRAAASEETSAPASPTGTPSATAAASGSSS